MKNALNSFYRLHPANTGGLVNSKRIKSLLVCVRGHQVCLSVPVRHSQDHALHSALTGPVDDGLQGRDERLAAFQAEAFLWRPLPLKELLKPANSCDRWYASQNSGSITSGLRVCRTDRLTWWSGSSCPTESSSLPRKTAWFLEFRTFVGSTGTAPRHLWTWTPPRYADSRPSRKHRHEHVLVWDTAGLWINGGWILQDCWQGFFLLTFWK